MSPCFSVLISNFCAWVVVSLVFLKWFSAPTLFGFFHLSCNLNSCNQNTRFGTGTVRPRTTLTGFRGCLVLRVTYSNPNQVSGIPPSLQEQPVRAVLLQLCSAASPTVATAMFPSSVLQPAELGGWVWVGCWLCWSHWDHVCQHPELWGCSLWVTKPCKGCYHPAGPWWLLQGAGQEYASVKQCLLEKLGCEVALLRIDGTPALLERQLWRTLLLEVQWATDFWHTCPVQVKQLQERKSEQFQLLMGSGTRKVRVVQQWEYGEKSLLLWNSATLKILEFAAFQKAKLPCHPRAVLVFRHVYGSVSLHIESHPIQASTWILCVCSSSALA